MAKVLNREVFVTKGTPGEDDYEEATLHPGDKVPGWAEEYMEDEWYTDREDGTGAAGLDLVAVDHTWSETCRAADRAGVEYKKSWSKEQIAAAIMHHLFADEMGAFDEDSDYEYDPSQDAKLFDETNADGNVMAPDNDKGSSPSPKSAKAPAKRNEDPAGGTQS